MILLEEGQAGSVQEAYRRKMQELQKQYQAEMQAKAALKAYLEPAAYERMMNIKLSNPELFTQLLSMVGYLAQQGKIGGNRRLGGEELKKLAGAVVAKTRRESKITRLSK